MIFLTNDEIRGCSISGELGSANIYKNLALMDSRALRFEQFIKQKKEVSCRDLDDFFALGITFFAPFFIFCYNSRG